MEDGTTTGWVVGEGNGQVTNVNNTLVVKGKPSCVIYYSETDDIADGALSASVTPTTANCQVGLVFRYVDETQYAMVGYESGQWYWRNGSGGEGVISAAGTGLVKDVPVTIRIAYVGSAVTLWVNDIQIFTDTFAELPTDAGKIGLCCSSGGEFVVDDVAIYSE